MTFLHWTTEDPNWTKYISENLFFFFHLEISESDIIINGLKNMKEAQKIGILEEAHAFEIQ